MKLTSSVTSLLLAAAVSAASVHTARQSCPEASRFGGFSVSPTTVSPGDTVTISADFTCSFTFGIIPAFTDYYIEVPVNNNGHEPPILLARRQPNVTVSSPTDEFTVKIPFAFFFAGANYTVILDNTFPTNGTNGTPFFQVGGIEGAALTINTS